MSTVALRAARAKLMADPALTAYFSGRYGKDAKHIIGYKRPVNANDFPALCYVPIEASLPDEIGGLTRERVSLVMAVNEPGMTSDVFDGISQCDTIQGLILACLEQGALGGSALYLGTAKVVFDQAARHPFHERELSILLAAR